MKKNIMFLMLVAFFSMISHNVFSQEITINLMSGWNWISYPNAEQMSVSSALENLTPSEGDMILSRFQNASYHNGVWRGTLRYFVPGMGYMYYSNRSEAVSFTFAAPNPQFTVTTEIPTSITTVSAVVGGTVSVEEGNHIFASGVCWGTEQMPTIDGNHIPGGTIAGSISDTLDNLVPNTTYYVRAYVVTDYGLAYGEELSFTTESNVPVGAIGGLFSVSDSQQVYFSQGNLQYIGSASTPYWKFAENQWDYLGTATGQNSSEENVDRDLFGWGTSGYNHGAICYQPWSTSENTSDYYAYGQYMYNLNDQTGQADWGYNPISNGGDQPNQWHTLSRLEWKYVFDTRSTASGIRYAKAQVNDVNGVILLPDDWSADIYELNGTNTSNVNFSSNTITESDWGVLEQAGAVFLPITGVRYGIAVGYVSSGGYYWSASYYDYGYAHRVSFSGSGLSSIDTNNRSDRCLGHSVRLVHDAE